MQGSGNSSNHRKKRMKYERIRDQYGRRGWTKNGRGGEATEEEEKGEKSTEGIYPPKPGDKRKIRPKEQEFGMLEARTEDLDLERDVGKKIFLLEDNSSHVGGYFCKECGVTFNDSLSYVEHINGRQHNKTIGKSMKVLKSGIKDVQLKFLALKKNKLENIQPKTFEEIEQKLEMEDKQTALHKKKKKKKVTAFPDFNENDIQAFGFPAGFK